jgi:putative transposase
MLNYKYRLYPTKEQEKRLVDILEINRIVYNYFVNNNFHSRNDMNYALTELKERQPVLNNYHSKMLQMVSTKIAGAWSYLEGLESRCHNTGKGKLKPVKYGKCNSFTYNQSGFKIDQKKDGKYILHLSKFGNIEVRIHRQPINIKQITIMRHASKWFAIMTCATLKRLKSSLMYSKPIGIDVGITHYAYDSAGNNIDNPLFMTKELKHLRRAGKKASRRVKGSKNHKKAISWLQHLHHRIVNKRRNFLHNLSTEYSRKYDLIFVERLKLQNMNKNHHLARHIMDSGWGTFKKFLEYKANRLVEVNPYNTSIECSKCGNLVPKTLAVRIHNCGRCGVMLNRDYNAALNILQKGLSLLCLPMQHGEVTPVETLSVVVEAGTNSRALAVSS